MGALLCLATACSAPEPTPLPTTTAGPTHTPEPSLAAAPGSSRALVAPLVESVPTIDGERDALWSQAPPLTLPLHLGLDGDERVLDVELRALHDGETVAFIATWADEPDHPPAAQDSVRNKLVVHWIIPTPEGGDPFSCMVACHTAFADADDRFVYLAPETIPTGHSGSLPVAGGRKEDVWTIEWSRPLISPNPLDIQFVELGAEYDFMVKVFLGIDGEPDAISNRTHLVLAPS